MGEKIKNFVPTLTTLPYRYPLENSILIHKIQVQAEYTINLIFLYVSVNVYVLCGY
jgi:hypothetical protein